MSNYCIDSYDDHEFLQGDLFKSINPTGQEELFVIISADCDIANNKLGKSGFACLDVSSLNDYFFSDFSALKHQKIFTTELNSIIETINEQWMSLSEQHKPLENQSIKRWIEEDDVSLIISSLKIDKKETITQLSTSHAIIKKYLNHQKNPESKNIELLAIVNKADHNTNDGINKTIKKFMKELSGSPPQDLFFIPSIPSLEQIGYVVKLRSLFFVPVNQCFSSISQAKEASTSYIRIGRLTPTFKHALSQQFGVLFSRIGFPNYYEQDVKDSFSIFLEKF
ncbi:hypothetical protein [Cronobacter sakazakii]|uniref:hypothetical protein n=1 Tax=Cronobacter sakazakii TaxID=28141 RepID=UPI000CFA9586|nr:hypothetical protein [Cronobacter sakazakii]